MGIVVFGGEGRAIWKNCTVHAMGRGDQHRSLAEVLSRCWALPILLDPGPDLELSWRRAGESPSFILPSTPLQAESRKRLMHGRKQKRQRGAV